MCKSRTNGKSPSDYFCCSAELRWFPWFPDHPTGMSLLWSSYSNSSRHGVFNFAAPGVRENADCEDYGGRRPCEARLGIGWFRKVTAYYETQIQEAHPPRLG